MGSPSDTALNTMCVGLSLAIEKVLWETELRQHNAIQLSIPQSRSQSEADNSRFSLSQSASSRVKQYPLWKKILFFFIAITFSIAMGVLKFLLGDHTLNQIMFGWMLGAWIAFSYYGILRDYVHAHVENLINGRSYSRKLVYFSIATFIWFVGIICILVTFLVVKDENMK